MAITKLTNLVNPEVMGDMIEAKIPAMVKFTPFAKIDDSLMGTAGDTKKIPVWAFVGSAEDVAEGSEVSTSQMTASTKEFTIKKAMKSISITQEAVNSGLGDPVAQAETQLTKAVAVKVDNDVLAVAKTSTLVVDNKASVISYEGIVDGVGKFDEEEITDKVMFVAPEQVTTLRKDSNFISADKYNNNVVMTGEIGMIAGVRIIPSKKITAENIGSSSSAVQGFVNPIIKLEASDSSTEYTTDELPAITILLKKDVQVDTEWFPKKQTMDITVAKYYGVALTNESKVVLVKFKQK